MKCCEEIFKKDLTVILECWGKKNKERGIMTPEGNAGDTKQSQIPERKSPREGAVGGQRGAVSSLWFLVKTCLNHCRIQMSKKQPQVRSSMNTS